MRVDKDRRGLVVSRDCDGERFGLWAWQALTGREGIRRAPGKARATGAGATRPISAPWSVVSLKAATLLWRRTSNTWALSLHAGARWRRRVWHDTAAWARCCAVALHHDEYDHPPSLPTAVAHHQTPRRQPPPPLPLSKGRTPRAVDRHKTTMWTNDGAVPDGLVSRLSNTSYAAFIARYLPALCRTIPQASFTLHAAQSHHPNTKPS